MKFLNKDLPYLSGEKFSEGLDIRFSGHSVRQSRLEYLKTLATGKKVIHFGCADHQPLIKQKIAQNNYLHKILTDSASLCYGLDINVECLNFLRKEIGFTNVFEFDLFKDKLPAEVLDNHYDYVIMGEILEHVENPVLFLQKMKEVFAPICDRIIITVPNSFSLVTQLKSLRGIEYINTDHKFWFTPFTLAKVAMAADLCPEEMDVVFGFNYNLKKKLISKFFPFSGDSIVGIFKLN